MNEAIEKELEQIARSLQTIEEHLSYISELIQETREIKNILKTKKGETND